MATALFTDAELICFDHDIIKIIRKIKNQHQRADIYSIHKKIIKIPDYHDVSKEFLNIRIENLLKNGRIRNKPNRGNPSFTLNDVIIDIPIHDDSYSVSHVETPSTEYNLQTPNNSPIASTIPETQELITNMVNDVSFTEATSPEEELQAYSVSEHIVSHLQSPTVLENELFLDNMEKEARFVNFKNNIIAELTKIISEKIKTELKTFKTDSLKELSESLTWYKNETNVLKEECKSKDMIIAKLSKTIENLTNKKPEVISRDVQTNSNQPTKEPPLWEIMSMSELSSNSDGTQEEVTESSNFKQPKINLKQQLEQVRLQKKLEYNNYQSQQRDKTSNDQDIYSPGTCVIIGDSILNGLIEENISKQHNVRIRKFPGATVDDLNYHVHPILRKKPKHIIIHIGTNDATHSTSREILDKLLKLKTLIKETLPETEVTFSAPTIRSDNGKAALTVRNLCGHLLDLNMDILDNRNITSKHLARKGLHLNKAGSTRLAKNIHKLRKF